MPLTVSTVGEGKAYLMPTFVNAMQSASDPKGKPKYLFDDLVGVPLEILGVVTAWPRWTGNKPEDVEHDCIAYKVKHPDGRIHYIKQTKVDSHVFLTSEEVKHGVFPELRDNLGNKFKTRADIPT